MFVFSKSPFYNKKLSDYCKQTTMESIRRIVENKKPTLDKNKYVTLSLLKKYTMTSESLILSEIQQAEFFNT